MGHMVEKSPLKKVLGWACRLILAGVFVGAGAIKAMDPQAFAIEIGHYRLLPLPLTLLAGVYLPWLELTCGIAVLFRFRQRAALLILASLCLLFCAAMASAWGRGLDINCGCFGKATTTTLPIAFIRSFALGSIALYLLYCHRDLANDSAAVVRP